MMDVGRKLRMTPAAVTAQSPAWNERRREGKAKEKWRIGGSNP
jgi:hypothetical protein